MFLKRGRLLSSLFRSFTFLSVLTDNWCWKERKTPPPPFHFEFKSETLRVTVNGAFASLLLLMLCFTQSHFLLSSVGRFIFFPSKGHLLILFSTACFSSIFLWETDTDPPFEGLGRGALRTCSVTHIGGFGEDAPAGEDADANAWRHRLWRWLIKALVHRSLELMSQVIPAGSVFVFSFKENVELTCKRWSSSEGLGENSRLCTVPNFPLLNPWRCNQDLGGFWSLLYPGLQTCPAKHLTQQS